MPDQTPNCHPLAEKAKCNCGSPDGVGTHLVGCHVYDTPLMEQLRYDHHICREAYDEALQEVVYQAFHKADETKDAREELGVRLRALTIICGKIAVEDEKNPNGIHDDEPWIGLEG